ncbi:MAG: type III pantothenate kinase [Verrucomicrobiae bacterium]|nr:type III pantothenate kinase [Verrucomicrobiae bacterium]
MNILLIDIGNTNTHLGLGSDKRVRKQADVPTLHTTRDGKWVRRFLGATRIDGCMIASVVPKATPAISAQVLGHSGTQALVLRHSLDLGIGIRYPKPGQIGADRLANAVALTHLYGAPGVVVDFGTAVTFDIVNDHKEYIGGVIAPGLAAMTTYLHERTAQLPAIQIREPHSVVGKNTVDAMQIGAVHGYRGLIREILAEVKHELRVPRLRVVATGGYAELIARRLPEIQEVNQLLTLEGLRLIYLRNRPVGE